MFKQTYPSIHYCETRTKNSTELLPITAGISSEEVIVNVKNGDLRGCIKNDYKGHPYYSFQGIPYAKPPLGELRFKVPEAPESWSGIRDARTEGNRCYSKDPFLKTYSGSEDCLYLNVYTPELPLRKKLLKPVMFWIHGGNYLYGSGGTEFYGPEYLITQNVVLVTINYRLGLLGFLSFQNDSLEIFGNAGLKDQIMALRWVHRNIVHFGGDPNNVTIFGQGVGSICVHCLILSSLAKGLIHKAIMQSGTTLCTLHAWEKCTSAVAVAMDMENSTEWELYEILQSMPVDDLLKIQDKLRTGVLISTPFLIGPIVESENATMPLLTKKSIEILRSGNYNHVPIIIGYTSREGLMFHMDNRFLSSKYNVKMTIENVIPYNLNIPIDSSLYKTVCAKIKKFYFGTEEPSLENDDQYYLLQGDVCIAYSVYSTIKLHRVASKKPIYFYRMSVESNLNFFKQFLKLTNTGVCHGDDIKYLFKSSIPVFFRPHSVEEKGIEIFTKLWTEFARTGNPNPIEQGFIGVIWKPVESGKNYFLNIGENITVGVNPDHNRIQFWESIYELHSQ